MTNLVEKEVLRNYEIRQILKKFLAKDEMEIKEIKKINDVNKEKVDEYVTKLKESGFIKKTRENKYSITEEGKKLFAKQLKKRKKEVEELLEKINYK